MEKLSFWANPKNYWLRWIGVLPMACIAYVLGYAFLMIINWLSIQLYYGDEANRGWMALYIWPAIATGMASFYFVTLGAIVAPTNKVTVAFILMILLCLLSGTWVILIITTHNYSHILALVAQIIGCIAGHYHTKEELD